MLLLLLLLASFAAPAAAQRPDSAAIPLPEHPRPDYERAAWVNLNGPWRFRFDKENVGESQGWARDPSGFPLTIQVPFPWGSELSGVPDEAPIGWYHRSITVPAGWQGERVFLVIGASDWRTTAWLDGKLLGAHQGGYTPFDFELTPHLTPGRPQQLVLRVDDSPHDFKLEGKQGYGQARGIWQTPYLEARGGAYLAGIHFTPDIDAGTVRVRAMLAEPAPSALTLGLQFERGALAQPSLRQTIPAGAQEHTFEVSLPNARLWTLDDPYLYQVEATLGGGNLRPDAVKTYFGMRKVSVVNLPGTDIPYIALNNKPLYLQITLDQSYHPGGFYTFPTDAFMRDEILRSRQIGLNAMRVHIKVEVPRKLYWADRLGMLIMADTPNSWGEPTPEMRSEVTYTMRRQIQRDYNHPSIFAWVPFNETWGLFTQQGDRRVYTEETQDWVASMYRLAKSLDGTRLVEDNSVCCGIGHTETDINSWHHYLPGWMWESTLAQISRDTYPGAQWNFEKRFKQGGQPNINSEFGNVWGYEGSTGDVDYTWDYHRAVNAFRRHPKIAGWLYTEHHDVINEWNGYWRFDRSEKFTGLDELVEGMSLRDLHAPFYIAIGDSLSREVKTGEAVDVPLFASFMTDAAAHGQSLILRTELYGWDALGVRHTYAASSRAVPFKAWMHEDLEPLRVTMPREPAVAVLALRLEDAAGKVLHRNFTTFIVKGALPDEIALEGGKRARVIRFAPGAFKAQQWSAKQWDVLDGKKVNGAGSGYFEYRVAWPKNLDAGVLTSGHLLLEASAKQLFGKDRPDTGKMEGDYMRGLGTLDPSRNPNAYPMTDETRFPSMVVVRVNGEPAGTFALQDDPADHRGILSWHYQLRDRKLREAGSYGERVSVALPAAALRKAAAEGELVLRLEVPEALPGGLAIYGAEFGRYMMDPTLLLVGNR